MTNRGDRGNATLSALEILGVVLVACLVLVGAYLGYWWLARDTHDRGADLRRHGFEQQTTFRDQASRDMADVAAADAQLADPSIPADERTAIAAQRKALVTRACQNMTHLVGDVDASVDAFRATNCP